jgi:hypothetical protein
MATIAQITANRLNAQLSTGPQTPDGKSRAAQNSRTHGLTSQTLIISDQDRAAFDELHAGLLTEVQPHGPLEMTLFHELLAAAWNLHRLRILEAQADPLDDQNEAKFNRYQRYHTRLERTLHRSLRELRNLQTNRALTADTEAAATLPAPMADAVRIQTKRSQFEAAYQRARMDMMNAWIYSPPPVQSETEPAATADTELESRSPGTLP